MGDSGLTYPRREPGSGGDAGPTRIGRRSPRVKGYTKGANSNDLLTVGRHRRVYEKKYEYVQRMWYVANSFRLDSPEARPKILDGADEHIEDFAQDDGLVIDTRDLFNLLKRVETADLAKESARGTLKATTGRFQLD